VRMDKPEKRKSKDLLPYDMRYEKGFNKGCEVAMAWHNSVIEKLADNIDKKVKKEFEDYGIDGYFHHMIGKNLAQHIRKELK